ncbi:MAG: RecQ family ATP-dependent DNA helicase [Prevotellaceae bacterium]|jgi:ATP-dependent DNA helicase RecQ|nr:RecQ family ATP-dependent DNA helicase [Prevotellaceae bacterium]
MVDFSKILFQYWGHHSFRALQEEVVQAAYDGRDTLALMPTGGGKSVCFQVPALAKEGICLVVTPLIALMKDQVENLQKKGIKALAIYSGMSSHEIKIALDNCLYGEYKFLYLSPERLGTDVFKAYVAHMKVNLIAIDESHCISQWGYDFRPSYMKIAELRDLLPGVPMLALTATATPKVAQDIMERLRFREKHLLKKSFERKNLAYVVRHTEHKRKELLKIAAAVPGTAVVYVRTRGATADVSNFLRENGFSADAYHGGMGNEERSRKQDEWKSGATRIMVATNAFGMGIDKADVRWVAHMDMPDSLEAYYQEAGRAGRDEKKAYAVLLYSAATDKASMDNRYAIAFPPIKEIRRVYHALGSFLQIPTGTGRDTVHDFNLGEFCSAYKVYLLTAYSALQFLQRDGYIEFVDEANNPSRAMFIADRDELYKVQVANPSLDLVVKALLRAYTGLFSQYSPIDEAYIARAIGLTPNDVYSALHKLSQLKVISYIPRKKTPLIIYTENRLDDKNLRITKENYADRKERYIRRVEHILAYASASDKCRSQLLLAYFGETNSHRCGQCDVCLERKELDVSKRELDELVAHIKKLLSEQPLSMEKLVDSLPQKAEKLFKVTRWLLDNEKIDEKAGALRWSGKDK